MSTSKTAISWTERTWNPTRGCSLVSAGCTNCYAMRQAARWWKPGEPYARLTRTTEHGPVWTGELRTIESALREPLTWKKPARIFVNSMSDLFHPNVPLDFIARVFSVMDAAKHHTFQILTKRPERMLQFCQEIEINGIYEVEEDPTGRGSQWDNWPLPNVWLGTSVEDQASADARIPELLKCPAAVRWISYEPALGPVDSTPFLWGKHELVDRICQNCPRDADCECGYHTRKALELPAIDWVVVGGESGPRARTCNIDWLRGVVKQCQAAEVPVYVKQLGAHPYTFSTVTSTVMDVPIADRKGERIGMFPPDLRVREYPTPRA